MTDLLTILPEFPSDKYAHLIVGLEKHHVTTADLLTLDALELARRAQLPGLDLKHFIKDVIFHLHNPYDSQVTQGNRTVDQIETFNKDTKLVQNGLKISVKQPFVSTLDDTLDKTLNGGISPGYVTEITGESGAGKTQFLLTLLLSVQLKSPDGLGRGAVYISTEHALPTQRLSDLLATHPKLKDLPSPPSLSSILSIQVPDLETQDHILTYQLPVVVKSRSIGLVIIDSITANYRAEAERHDSRGVAKAQVKSLAARSIDLVRTGTLLRQIAIENNCAIVVANQVADRFESRTLIGMREHASMLSVSQEPKSQPGAGEANDLLVLQRSEALPLSSPLTTSQPSSSPAMVRDRPSTYDRPRSPTLEDPRLLLNHQMLFFTGWGDSEDSFQQNLKTPALGLTWTNQIACRIALTRESAVRINSTGVHDTFDSADGSILPESDIGGADWSKRRWRRWMRVVFAGWAQEVEEGHKGVEFEVWTGGIRAVMKT